MTLNKKIGFVVVSSLVIASAAQAEDGFKAGGFVDPQLLFTQGLGARAIMNDGAIYLSKSLGEGSAVLDLAFSDIQLSLGTPTSTAAGVFLSNLGTGSNKSQAFVAYKYSNGFSWKFGQFDGIFGYERNDTVDSLFAAQGGVYSLQPVVHEALLVGYEVSKALNVQAFVGGSDGTGLGRPYGASNRNPQIGAKVAYNDGLRLAVGGSMESEQSVADKSAMFLNATAGMDFGSASVDAEYTMDSTGADDASTTGIGVYAAYGLNETTKIGARFTMLNNIDRAKAVGDNSEDSTMAITVGPNFAMTKDLNVKINVNYNIANTGIKDVDSVNTATGVVAATYRF